MSNGLILFGSITGNTEKVAIAIKRGLEKAGMKVTMKKVTSKNITEATKEDLLDYKLVCLGSPVLHAFIIGPVLKYMKKKKDEYKLRGEIIVNPPKRINKSALAFCTYAGPHCGLNEALPAGKYIRQFFEHLGFDVKAEWYEIGEFIDPNDAQRSLIASTKGVLGDIRGRPSSEDLAKIELNAIKLATSL